VAARAGASGAATAGDNVQDFDEVGDRVEALLDRLHHEGGVRVGRMSEELVRLLVGYYGAGLERVVELVSTEHPELLLRLSQDPLVESQLILHGLHPVGVDERIERALDEVRPYLGSHAGGVAYLGVDDEGVAHLRLDGSCNGCPSSTVTVRLTIEEALLAAAPEVVSINVDGAAATPEKLLQIGLRPGLESTAPAPDQPRWLHPSARDLPGPGQRALVLLDGRPVLVCRLAETYYAYTDCCPLCGGSLADATLDGQVITCVSCRGRYDVRLAGQAADGSGRRLEPLPLLDDVSGIRIALLPAAV
jgi:Fe-S cluster biogenesis protein NfuA/nitrite reductase/ring-hydroxylating ferredoxin subunit